MATAEVLPIVVTAKDESKSAFDSLRGHFNDTKSAVDALKGAIEGMASNGVGGVSAVTKIAQLARNPYVALGLAVAGVGIAAVATHKHLQEIADAASRTGEKVSTVEQLGLAVRKAGGDFEAAAKGLTTLKEGIETAVRDGGTLEDLFDINDKALTDAAGKVRPLRDVYKDVAGFIQNAFSEQERLLIATAAFGSEAGPSMVKAIMAGADAFERLSGGTPGLDEAVRQSKEFDRLWKEIARSGDGFKTILLSGVLPVMKVLYASTQGWASLFGSKSAKESLYLLNNAGSSRAMGQADADSFYAAVRGRAGATNIPSKRKEEKEDRNDYDRALNSIGKHTALMEADARAVGKTAGEHERLRVEAQLLDAAVRAKLDPTIVKNSETFQKYAERAQKAADALAAARLQSDLMFERSQMGRSEMEQAVAGRLRGAGIDPNSDQGQFLAQQIRINETLRETGDIARDAMKGFIQDLRNGVSAGEALVNVLNRIGDKLLNKAIDTGISSLLSGFTGGGYNTSATGGGNPFPVPTFHAGGIAGGDVLHRYVHPAHFNDAPRYHGGIDYAGGEMPAILKRGEEVGWPAELARKYGGGGSALKVTVNNYGSDKVDVQQRDDGNGGVDLEIVVGQAAASQMSKPGSALRSATDQRGQLVRR